MNIITIEQLEKIYNYLKKPIASGIWILDGVWLEKEGITAEIIKEISANNKNAGSEVIRRLSVFNNFQGMNSILTLFKLLVSEKRKKMFQFTRGFFQKTAYRFLTLLRKKLRRNTLQSYNSLKRILIPPTNSIHTREFFNIENGLILFWQ